MRELSIHEVDVVAGASFASRLGAAGLGALVGLSSGTMRGGVAGGSVGGILGFGLISSLVTMIWGGALAIFQGAVYGLVNDWDKTLETFNNYSDQFADLTITTPKV